MTYRNLAKGHESQRHTKCLLPNHSTERHIRCRGNFRPVIFFALVLLLALSDGVAQVISPSSFAGFETGDRFSRHHEIQAYFEHVARESDFVKLVTYGESYRHRPLFAALVSSGDNMRALDTIRVNNRRMAGLADGNITGRTAAILWMSYGVHGNESSSPEAAMQTFFTLVRGMETGDRDIQEWLETTVVMIDPVLNPDGRERYVNWFDQTTGRRPDPRLETREHNEPWPGGRTNHYYFDLNRDWVWQTQIESRHRIAFYNTWMPHVHADFHEMFRNDYFFPPAPEPIHPGVTPWQREFQDLMGDNHSARLDQRYERYFTREIFDLYYPGYGDTWPTFNGAIGMTYEQMGHGRAGTKMITEDGDTLTLADRIRNHNEIGLSTVEITAKNSTRLLEEFQAYFQKSQNEPNGQFMSFVISGENQSDKISVLLDFLDRQEIRYEPAAAGQRMTGRHYLTGEEQSRRTLDGDIVVPMHQPKSVLANVLFDPNPALSDSIVYDLTAWAIPYAMGLEAWAVESRIRSTGEQVPPITRYTPLSRDVHYAYLFSWGDVRDAAFLADLLQAGIRVNVAGKSFTTAGEEFPPGTGIIFHRRNRHIGDRLATRIDALAAKHDRKVTTLASGRTEEGIDLGSPHVHAIRQPAVAMPAGEGTQSNHVGYIRYFFDYTLDYPLALFHPDDFGNFPLTDYDVLILPELQMEDWTESDRDKIMNWVREGGRLIAISSVIEMLAEVDDLEISLRSDEKHRENMADKDSEKDSISGEKERKPNLMRYEDRRREAVAQQISGAVYRAEVDDSHPLAFGMGEIYAVLKQGTRVPELLESGWNVIRMESGTPLSGWSGYKTNDIIKESLAAGTIAHGSGQIILLTDHPLYRGFWRNGQLLFSNAVFQHIPD